MICNMESVYTAARKLGQDGMDLAHTAWIKVARSAEPGRDYTGLVIAAMATLRIDGHRRSSRFAPMPEGPMVDSAASRPDLAYELQEVIARDPIVCHGRMAGLGIQALARAAGVSVGSAHARLREVRHDAD